VKNDIVLNIINFFFLVYYIGSATESVNDKCPTNAARNENNGNCECLPGYKVINGNRTCG
jgi:hypothetical protein